MPDMVDVAANLAAIHARIAKAVQARGPGPLPTLIAVSKRHSSALIQAAYAAGQRDFGENYAQELEQKAQELKEACPQIRWHMIGPVQRNKVPKILGCDLLHTVDRLSLVQSLARRASEAGIRLSCLVQVNPGEAQKSGVSEQELGPLLDALQETQALSCRGLMLIPPDAGPDARRRHFDWLAGLGATHADRFDQAEPVLSMGMSGDFEEAIQAGSTMVRVGSAIFGPRSN